MPMGLNSADDSSSSVILVVEDSPTQSAKLRFVLEQAGYTVLQAFDGLQGLNFVNQTPIDLIISDVNMPQMNGFEMCSQIKSNAKFKHIPLVLLTTLSDPESLLKGLEAGADYHISKPIDQEYLLDKIREFLVGTIQNLAVDGVDDVELSVRSNKYRITASRAKILNFLLATYEDAERRNFRLQKAEEALYDVNRELEAKVAERTDQLRRAAQEWRECFDSLEDIMVLVDSNYRITRVNQKACQVFGKNFDDIIGSPCYEVMHGTSEPPDFCPHGKVLNGGRAAQREYDDPRLGKTISVSYSPMTNHDGQISHVVHVISDVSEMRLQQKKAQELTKALATAFSGVTEALSDLSAIQDPYTAGHARNVANLAVRIAEEMGIDENQRQGLWVCGLLHDIGKVSVSHSILNKPGKLSEHEWGIISGHPEKGYEALKRIPFPWPVADVVRQHHERLDASGYPLNLSGDQVHIWARILAVADVVDAMTNDRPYRPGLSLEVTLKELNRCRGISLDAGVVDAYLEILRLEQKNILVLDDDPKVLDAITKHLYKLGYNPTPFGDAGKALGHFKENKCRLVVANLHMPDLDGLEIIRQIRSIDSSCQIIVVSAYGNKQDAVEALRLGATDFLEKPINLQDLTEALERTACSGADFYYNN